MKKLLNVAVLSLPFLLMACDSVKDVDYYKKNPDKAKKVVTECFMKEATGEYKNLSDKKKQNCQNASRAMMGF